MRIGILIALACIGLGQSLALTSHPDGHGPSTPPARLYSKHGHVPRSEKEALFRLAGVPRSHRKYYVVDHTIPVELGGSDEFSNLQLQSKPEAKAKNKIEKYLVQRVKRGELSLEQARQEAADWKQVRRK